MGFDIVSYLMGAQSGGGGGGSRKNLIASGTVVGSGTSAITVPVGKSMPQTDFVFECYVDGGTEVPYNTTFKIPSITMVVSKAMATYDLSTDGEKQPTMTAASSWAINNAGTVTTVSAPAMMYYKTLRSGAANSTSASSAVPTITRDSNGFSVSYNREGTGTYAFIEGETYHWALYYFGDNPSQDIVTIPSEDAAVVGTAIVGTAVVG